MECKKRRLVNRVNRYVCWGTCIQMIALIDITTILWIHPQVSLIESWTYPALEQPAIPWGRWRTQDRNTQSSFSPAGWMAKLTCWKMSVLTNQYTCPGWIFKVPCQPHPPTGNEYVCCGLSGIKQVEGKDCPKEILQRKNHEKGRITSGQLLQVTNPYCTLGETSDQYG